MTTSIRFVCLFCVAVLFGSVGCGGPNRQAVPEDKLRPNIVVIMVDDMGWADLACYGNDVVDTPVLDRFAKQGMLFTDAYAASPVCSPTRAAMMTGQSPARVGLTNHAAGHPPGFAPRGAVLAEAPMVYNLARSYVTIAERLRDAGYRTAHIGKWHLSSTRHSPDQSIRQQDLYPEHQGFDLNIGGNSSGGPPSFFSPYRNPTLPDGPEGEYLPARLADEAIRYIKADRDGPFFLNWWPYSVHWPMQAPGHLIQKYRRRMPGAPENEVVYQAMIEGFDAELGRFFEALDDAGLAEDTLVIFTSDNGSLYRNTPLRSVKGHLYEGGIRVPFMVRWPGVVEPGTRCATPIISMDCVPTLIEAAGLQAIDDRPIDGVSLAPLLTRTGGLERDAICFHYPNYAFHKQNRLGSAVRVGDYKLIKFYDDDSVELYNLADDIGETTDLADQMPGRAKRMEAKLGAWLAESDAAMPVRVEGAAR
ncbi:MAG: sulfatase [Phycisphaeraceae bacterium]